MKLVTGSDTLKVQGRTILGLVLKFYLKHTTNDTAFTGQPVNLQNMNMKMTYTYEGGNRSVDIMQDAVLPIALPAAFRSASFKGAYPLGTVNWKTLVAEDTAVKHEILLTVKIPFQHPLNCTKGRFAEITPNISSAVYGSTVDQATSYCEIDYEEGDGNDPYVPVFKVHAISGSESSKARPLGDFVESIHLINTDKVSLLTADHVVNTVSLSGDKFEQINDDMFDLLAKRDGQFELASDADLRGQCFEVYDTNRSVINKCNINVSYNSANVTGGKNFIVVQHAFTDQALYDRYLLSEKEHGAENAALLR